MKKYIFNLMKFSLVLLIIPLGVFLVDPFNYYDNSLKIDIDRMHLFRINNVADWAMVEVDKIDQSLKSEIKTCVIGDSRSRLMISFGHVGGWTNRISGIDLDVLDLSFGGANLDESFALLENEIKNLDSLEKIIISVPIDRLLINNHDVNRIVSSAFNSRLSSVEYLTDVNLVANIIENREKIFENKKKIESDTSKTKEEELVNNKSRNLQIRLYKSDPKQIKWRNRIVEYKKERYETSIKNRDKTIPYAKSRITKDDKIRQSFLRIYEAGSPALFDKNLEIFKSQLASFSAKYEVIIMIPTYDDILYSAITESYNDDYQYYIESLKKLPYKIIDLQDISNEFVFADPVHGSYENGTLIYKINHEFSTFNFEKSNWKGREAYINFKDTMEVGRSYLSIYSQIDNSKQQTIYKFTPTVSLQNTSEKDTIYLSKVNYYDANGKLLKKYLKKPIYISPLETLNIHIEEFDVFDITGSKFIFDWKTPKDCPEPIFEGLMSSTIDAQNLIFTTKAKRIN